MRALAAPVPTDKRARYIARNRGRLPIGPDRVLPLLWQLTGTHKLRRLMHGYRDGAMHPVVIDRLPLATARDVHGRIDASGLGGKNVLPPRATR